MAEHPTVKTSREHILDAAFEVMRTLGLSKATTKQIALQSGYSEAMLYKHFADKQELFLAVLEERIPSGRTDAVTVGNGDLVENLTMLVEHYLDFFVTAFPIAASVFSSPELLRHHREGVVNRDRGPAVALQAVESYLDAERSAGRIAADADCVAAARTLVGAAFHQAFLAAFAGQDTVGDSPDIARGIAQSVSRALI